MQQDDGISTVVVFVAAPDSHIQGDAHHLVYVVAEFLGFQLSPPAVWLTYTVVELQQPRVLEDLLGFLRNVYTYVSHTKASAYA